MLSLPASVPRPVRPFALFVAAAVVAVKIVLAATTTASAVSVSSVVLRDDGVAHVHVIEQVELLCHRAHVVVRVVVVGIASAAAASSTDLGNR